MLDSNTVQKVNGKVKWFNPYKGYGFITVETIPEDIFLHFAALEEANIKTLVKDDVISCYIDSSEKGYQVVKVEEVLVSNKYETDDKKEKVSAIMKWFNQHKGYGFAQLENGQDIFIHASLINKCSIKNIEPNQKITLVIHHTNLGYEALEIIVEKH